MERRKYNVLVAGCTQNFNELSGAIFTDEDIKFSYSNTSDETISMLQKKDFDIVLLDTKTEDSDGFQVCKMIRSTETIKEIPIIFLTSLAKEEIDKCYESGGDDYILKPFNQKELIGKIKLRLMQKRGADELIGKFDRKASVKLISDVARMKHEIQALREKNKLLAKTSNDYYEMEKLKNNFLKVICHELRTPVSGILGFVEILNENPNCVENNDILKTIIFASKNLKDYADIALMITQIEPSQINDNMRPTKLSSLLEYAIIEVMQNCDKKEIGINTNLKDKLAEVIIEPGLIKDVIRIILTNAANHSPVKGSISIKLTEFEDKLELEISNPGKGFEPDKLKNITAFLMKDGLNLRSEWPGMHFSVIKFVMDLHNGQVQISNPEEGGAMVKLIFPINAMKNKAFSEAMLQLN